MSDMGRLMVAYLWYAKITGEPIDTVNVDMIPASERCTWRQEALGDFTVTPEMKQVIKDAVNYTLEHPYEVPDPAAADLRCDQCRYEPEWIAWDGTTVPTEGGHYYLSEDVTLDEQITLPDGFTVALNLNGKTLTANSRAFRVCAGATLAIMDGVGTGKIQAAGVAGENGGVALVDAGGQLAVHGGLLTNTQTTNGIDTGGVLYVDGDMTMRGGLITGGKVTRAAENVYISATGSLTMADGQITGGTTNDVFLRGSATLSRWADIGDMCVSPHASGPALGDMVTISGDFTRGHVGLEIMADFAEDLDVGNGSAAIFGEENVHLVDTDENFGVVNKIHTTGAVPLSNLQLIEMQYCSRCEKNAVWVAMDEAWQTVKVLNGGHYYLDFTGNSYPMTERTVTAGHSVCLDLRDKGYIGTYRAFNLAPGATLNILGTGTISGRGTDGGSDGGVIYVAENATLNLYEATIQSDLGLSATRYAGRGGVLSIDGTFNMYGGELRGDTLNSTTPKAWPTYGGTVYVGTTGKLNAQGGQITGGTVAQDGVGACVYANGTVTLGGTAQIGELYLAEDQQNGPVLGEMLLVNGAYTGETVLNLDAPADDLVIGRAGNGASVGAGIPVEGGKYAVRIVGTELKLVSVIACEHCKKVVEWTAWDGSALPNEDGHYYLAADVQTDAASVLAAGSYSITVDLRGKTLTNSTRAFQVGNGATLSVMDSAGGGKIQAAGAAGEKQNGGVVLVQAGGCFNLYGGDVTLTRTHNSPYIGGIIHNSGTVKIAGGTLYGGYASYSSPNVYSGYAATVEITGGSVIAAEGQAAVYARGSVILSGDPTVTLLRLVPHSSGPALSKIITVKGSFTGDVLVEATGIAANVDIGAAESAQLAPGSLRVNGVTDVQVVTSDTELVVAKWATCEHCQKKVLWTPVVDTTYWQRLDDFAEGHYCLAFSGASYALRPKTVASGDTVCVDLNGKTFLGTYRAFVVSENATLNIMGSGRVSGRGTKAYENGGTVYVAENGVVNLYGGVLGTELGLLTDRGAGNGGVVAVDGTFNMYGGSINAVSASVHTTWPTLGGAVYVGATGVMNMNTGTVNSGALAANGSGACIYLSGKLNLAGDAAVEEVELTPVAGGPELGEMLTVTGAYTGTAMLALDSAVTDTDIGAAVEAKFADTALTVKDADGLLVVNLGGQLMVYDHGDPMVVSGEAGFVGGFWDLDDAIAACTDGTKLILMTPMDAGTFAVSKDLTLDLNGNDLTAVFTGSKTISVMDSKTDDFTVEDGEGYGVITGSLGANVKPADDYVKIVEDGKTSFHKVDLTVKRMGLRPSEVGLYFESDFNGDEVVDRNVTAFGVALSVTGDPDESTLQNKKHFTRFTQGFEDAKATSTILKGVMKDTNGYNTNLRNSNIQVYGRAYIEVDGEVTFGKTENRSLRQQVEGIDEKWDAWTTSQKRGVLNLYNSFRAVVNNWTMPKMRAEQVAEDKVMRLLVVGNSYSYDSTNLLHAVYQSQNPDKKVQIGVMYYSGCTVSQHLNFIQNQSAQYDYRRTDENGKWVTDANVTLDHGLLDQQWDIVVLQHASAQANQEDKYTDGTVGQLRDYIRSKLVKEPKFYWNMTWTYPQDVAFQDPNFDPKAPDSWASTLYAASQGSRMTQYTGIANCVSEHIATDPSFAKVLHSGTAIQYASNVLGLTDMELHRDWTHLSDLGRLFVAHLWYAEIEGLSELPEVDFDVIPIALRATYRQQALGDFPVTEEMQAGIREAVNWTLDNPFTVPDPVA